MGPVRIVVRPQNSNVAENGQIQMSASRAFFTGVGQPGGETVVDTTGNQSVFFYSTSGVANVGPYNGLVTGANGGPGITKIGAIVGSFIGEANLNVGLTSLTVTPNPVSVPLGSNRQFTATGHFGATDFDITDSVTWTTNDTSVFITNQPGFRGFAVSLAPHAYPYSVTVTATSGALNASATLNITAPIPTAVNITPPFATLACCPATTQQFQAIATLTDGTHPDMTASAVWNSSDTSFVTIQNGAQAGLATAVAHGVTNIYCTIPGQFGSADVTVTTTLQSVVVSPPSSNLEVGDTLQLAALGTYSDTTTQDITTLVNWSTDTPGVATVDATGLVTGQGTGGTAKITATLSTFSNFGSVTGIAATLKPRFAYVVNSGDYTVSSFIADPDTGRLRPTGWFNSENAPKQIVIDAQQRFAYLLETNGGGTPPCGISCVVQFNIDPVTGVLTPSTNPLVHSSVVPVILALEPQGRFLYVVNSGQDPDFGNNNSISGFTINPTTGMLSPITAGSPFADGRFPSGADISSIDFDSGGRHAYVNSRSTSDVWMYTINQATGALSTACSVASSLMSPCGGIPSGSSPYWVSVRRDPTGAQPPKDYAYVAYAGANQIWKFDINAGTGALSTMPTPVSSGGSYPYFLGLDPKSSVLYAINGGMGSDNITTFGINAMTGELTQVGGTVTAGTNIDWLALDVSGRFLYAVNFTSNDVSLFDITPQGSPNAGLPIAPTQASPTTRVRLNPFDIVFSSGTKRVKYKPLYAYVANFGSDNVSAYSISPASGELTPLSTPTYGAGSSPQAITTDSLGKHLYVANGLSNDISAFAINNGNGSLTSLATNPLPPYPGERAMSRMTLDPSNQFLYVGNFSSDVLNYRLDSTPGNNGFLFGPSATAVASYPNAVAVDPTGRFLFVTVTNGDAVQTYSINNADGSLNVLTSVAAPGGPESLAVDPSGRFVYVGMQNHAIRRYLIGANGALIFLDSTGAISPFSLAIDPQGRFLFSAPQSSLNTVYSFTIDPAIGALTPVGGWYAGVNPSSISIDPSGSYLYVTGENSDSVAGFAVNPDGTLSYVPSGYFRTGSFPTSVTTTGTLGTNTVTLNSITVAPSNPTVGIGVDQQFSATGFYSNGTTKNLTHSVSWTSSLTNIATISNTVGSQGVATGVAAGTTIIKASIAGLSNSTNLTVTGATLTSITVAPANSSVPIGGTKQFTATAHFSDNSTSNITASVQWLSTNTNFATISNAEGTEGRATGVAAGTTSIRATLNGITGSTQLTAVALASIAVTPPNPNRAPGQTQQFAAIGTFSDASTADITSMVTWSSANPAIAIINASGFSQALAQGSSVITATSGAISGNTTLTVGGAVFTNIQVTPSSAVVINQGAGATRQFTATGVRSDGTTANLTNDPQLVWFSSNTAAATISASGLATACGGPACSGLQTQIRATYSGVNPPIVGTALLNVR